MVIHPEERVERRTPDRQPNIIKSVPKNDFALVAQGFLGRGYIGSLTGFHGDKSWSISIC